jgi:hypothetical protein
MAATAVAEGSGRKHPDHKKIEVALLARVPMA